MFKTILKVTALGLVLGLAVPVQTTSAQISGAIHIRLAPPAARHEVRGARPDAASVWVGGYNEYDAGTNAYAWHAGRWDHAPRKGARWVAPRYKRQHGEYKYTPGRWK
jgi:hypothetical protein